MASRAVRRHHNHRVAQARRRLMSAFPRGFAQERSDNELATRHPLDCGRRCFLCHMDKLTRGGQRRAQGKRETEREIG